MPWLHTVHVPRTGGDVLNSLQNRGFINMMNKLKTNVKLHLNPNHVRMAIAAMSLVALVLGGSASAHWD
jgi:hypothetical protein